MKLGKMLLQKWKEMRKTIANCGKMNKREKVAPNNNF